MKLRTNYSSKVNINYQPKYGKTSIVGGEAAPSEDNEAPVAIGDSGYTTPFNIPLVITAADLVINDTDADDDALVVTAVGGATHGSVDLTDGIITFTPTSDYDGTASFTYTVSDGQGGTDTATVTITVEEESVDTTPVTIFESSPAMSGNDNGNAVTVFRTKLLLTGDMRDEFRVTIAPSATQQLTIAGVCAGKWNGDASYPDMVDPPVEALFASVGGFVDQTTEQTSDWTPVGTLAGMLSGDILITSYQTGASGHCGLQYATSVTGVDAFFQSDTFDGSMWTAQQVSSPVLGFNDINATNYGIVRVETRNVGGGEGGGGDPVLSDIPLAWDDARFASNTAGPDLGPGSPILTVPQTYTNKDWDNGPTLEGSTGNQAVTNWAEGSGVITLTDCRIRWKEGVRLGAAAGVQMILDGCFIIGFGDINEVGNPSDDDHADMIQADGTLGDITLINTTLRPYSDSEAQAIVATATGSDGFRWADNSSGTVTFENVVIRGGGRGITISADTGDTHISFENVFIVSEGDGFAGSGFYKILIQSIAGNIIIDKWINVCDATIVDGEIVAGTQHPSPDSGDDVSYQVLG